MSPQHRSRQPYKKGSTASVRARHNRHRAQVETLVVATPVEDIKKPDRYLLSQHPFYRKFRDSLKAGEPNFVYYLGALKLYGSE
ncbi:hypothetical protein NW759_001096 [Fusarium solani]|jgi:hypothetical protein|nr:hypothetical protein NW759_001096 [Fusarium solani]